MNINSPLADVAKLAEGADAEHLALIGAARKLIAPFVPTLLMPLVSFWLASYTASLSRSHWLSSDSLAVQPFGPALIPVVDCAACLFD